MTFAPPKKRVSDIIRELEPWLAAVLILIMVGLRSRTPALTAALATGDTQKVRQALQTSVVMQEIYDALMSVHHGTILRLPPEPQATLTGSLTIRNTLAEQWSAREAGRLITGLTDIDRDSVRAILSTQEVRHPDETEKALRGLITILPDHQKALTRLRMDLESQGLRPEIVDRKYSERADFYLRWRANMIARTETVRQATIGQLLLWQSQYPTWISPGTMVRWVTTRDDRMCALCAPMDGQTVPLIDLLAALRTVTDWSETLGGSVFDGFEVFVSRWKGFRGGMPPAGDEPPSGDRDPLSGFNSRLWSKRDKPWQGLGPPLHPSCRCRLVLQPGPVSLQNPWSPSWQPVMSPQEAKEWAADSVLPVMWHATDNPEAILREGFQRGFQRSGHYGEGIYLASRQDADLLWRTAITGAGPNRTVLQVQPRVHNILEWRDAPGTPSAVASAVKVRATRPAHIPDADYESLFRPMAEWADSAGLTEIMDAINENIARVNRGELPPIPGLAERLAFESAGYDALRITFSDLSSPAAITAGSNQVLVFDPQNLVVIRP